MVEDVKKDVVKKEKKSSVSVIDVADYVSKVSRDISSGVPRRAEAIRLAFEDYGADNFVTTISSKGSELVVFKN